MRGHAEDQSFAATPARAKPRSPGWPPLAGRLLELQASVGNAAVASMVAVQRQKKTAPPKLTISGVLVAGDPLTPELITRVNEAAKQVPQQFRRYVAYQDEVKVGGSLAWRANNPGALRGGPGEIGKVKGAVGVFAVFATMAEGRAAQKAVYENTYGKRKVRDAIAKLTPPSENDTKLYLKKLSAAGVDLDATVASQIDTLMAAVEANEGMIEGMVISRP